MSGEGEIQNVATIAPQHGTLEAPEALKALPAWLVWRLEQSPSEPKPRKIPYWTTGAKRHGGHGSPEDRSRLVTFAAARDFAVKRGFDGVGFAPLPEWGITALDFDQCIGPNGEIPAEILDIVGRTYAEYSPSGTGIRAFVRGNLGNHKDKAREGSFGFETFSTNGFVTLTGNLLPICELTGADELIADTPQSLIKLCEARFGSRDGKSNDPDDWMAGFEPRLGLTPEEIEEILKKLDPGCSREQWITIGMALHHECEGDDTGLDLWDEWSCTADNYVSREDLETQWASFDRRQGGPQVTMRSVLKMVKQATASTEALRQATEEGAKLADPDIGVRTPDDFDGKFPVVSAAMLASRPPGEWFVKGVIPQADLIVLFGESGSGKSFCAIDIGAAISRGVDWRERKVKRGKVIYIAAEGGGGVGKRFAAYAQENQIPLADLDIGIITVPPNFMEKEDITELAKAIGAAGGADLVIVDTYAQVTPGANENSGEDMGLALANARALRNATGATVLLVHHAGKDSSKGARGWSGIKAAADAELQIVRHENGDRELRISKMKDGDDGLSWGFKLDVIDLGIDADGDPVTSCVIREAGLPQPKTEDEVKAQRGVQRLGAIERHIMDIADQQYRAAESVRYDEIVTAAANALPAPDDGVRDSRRGRVVRALKNLSGKNGLLEITNGRVVFME